MNNERDHFLVAPQRRQSTRNERNHNLLCTNIGRVDKFLIHSHPNRLTRLVRWFICFFILGEVTHPPGRTKQISNRTKKPIPLGTKTETTTTTGDRFVTEIYRPATEFDKWPLPRTDITHSRGIKMCFRSCLPPPLHWFISAGWWSVYLVRRKSISLC